MRNEWNIAVPEWRHVKEHRGVPGFFINQDTEYWAPAGEYSRLLEEYWDEKNVTVSSVSSEKRDDQKLLRKMVYLVASALTAVSLGSTVTASTHPNKTDHYKDIQAVIVKQTASSVELTENLTAQEMLNHDLKELYKIE